jgi:hypothetical protein
MRPFIGCRDIGLKTVWRFAFEGPGTQVEPVPGVVYIDLGGSLREGIIDHHSGREGHFCSAELVVNHREAVYNHLMRDWLQLHDRRGIAPGCDWHPLLVTHRDPDWDSVVTCFLAIQLIETGDFPAYTDALVEYVREVDQGRYVCNRHSDKERFALHLAYLAMAEGRPSEEQMRCGLELLQRSMDRIIAARQAASLQPVRRLADLLPGSPGVLDWKDDPWFAPALATLSADLDRFANDLAKARILKAVPLPAIDGGDPIPVPAFVAAGPMESILHKYWVRSHGYPLFVCPFAGKNDLGDSADPGKVYPRVVLSVDPNIQVDGRKPHLLGLGFQLEQLEVRHRQKLHGGRDDRSGAPRFGDGYCSNDDPWYDGRAFDHTIVDSPRSGTVIPYQEIVRTACETWFWHVPLQGGVLSMIWRTQEPMGGSDPHPPKLHPALSDALKPFHEATREEALAQPSWAAELPGFSVALCRRKHPSGTCDAFHIATLTANSAATLENLVAARKIAIARIGHRPEYSLALLAPDARNPFSATPARIDYLLRRLNDDSPAEVARVSDRDELLLFDDRSLVLLERDPQRPKMQGPEPALLAYLAFLNETLVQFSSEISKKIPADRPPDKPLDAEPLCRDFLRFQTLYYRLDVCRTGYGRLIWNKLSAAVSLGEEYARVRSELDRLAQLEAQIAEQRRTSAERWMQFGLFAIALCNVYETAIAYFTAQGIAGSHPFWSSVITVTVVAASFYAWVELKRRGKSKKDRSS